MYFITENLQLVAMNECRVTVIIPTYQAKDYLGEALESVIQQTFDELEIIVIDDGSTDGTHSLIDDYKKRDSRITSIAIANSGMAAARRRGIAVAKGTWVAFLDADDRWLPNKVERQINLAASTNADVIISSGYYFGEVKKPWRVRSFSCNGQHLLPSLVKKNTLPLLSTMVKKVAIEKVNGFSLPRYYDIVADYDLWLRLCFNNYRFVGMGDDYLFEYRVHQQQSTHSSKAAKTCKVVADLFKHHYNEHNINKGLFQTGVANHFRELLDFEIVNGRDIELTLKELSTYLRIKIPTTLIGRMLRVNRRFAQVAMWRILGLYI